MSGKIFDLTPESEGPRYPVRRSASFDYGSSAGEVYLARTMALERAAEDALRDADWAVRRRAARGQGGGEDAVTLALSLAGRGVDGADWEREVRRAAADQAAGTAYLARKREERLRCQAAEAAAGRASLTTAPTSAAGMVQAQAEVGREGGALSPDLSGRIHAKRGGGQPLEATVRRGMEGVFQVSFGHVRIHADGEADALNRGVAAIAFTVGSDIFFRAGFYQPHSAAGQHLLAHELTHVVQQRTGSLGASGGGNASGTMTVGAVDDRHEQEAEATAHRVTAAFQQQGPALTASATSPSAALSRQHDPAVVLAPSAPGVARVPDETVRRFGLGDLWNAITHAGQAVVDEVKHKVSETVRKLPGYTLLTILLGQDPFTGQKVARTPTSLAHAVLELAPGGADLFQKLEQHHVLSKAFDWFNAHLATLSRVVMAVPGRLKDVLTSLGMNVVDDVKRVTRVFTGVLDQLVNFAKGAVGEVAGVAVQAIMAAFGPMGERVYEALKNAGAAMMQILRDPGTFLRNLGAAVKQGGGGFVQHIGAHLKEGLISLLTNGLFGAGVTLPAHLSLDAPGVITLALDLLNLGWDHLISLLTSRLGPRGHRVVSLIQAGSQELGPVASLVQDLRKGPLAFAHHLVESVGDVTGLLFAQVGDWLKTQMLPRMIIKLISMVVPGAGAASALMSIYEGISFLISHMDEIAALVNQVIRALGRIMAGDIGPAAQAIEDAMARTLPLVLKFLFRLMGINIDSIGDRIKSFLGGIRKRIDAALTKLIDFIVKHIPARLLHLPSHHTAGQTSEPPHGQQPPHTATTAQGALVVTEAFVMSGEPHTLTLTLRGTNLEAVMASKQGPLLKKIADQEGEERRRIAETTGDDKVQHEKVLGDLTSLATWWETRESAVRTTNAQNRRVGATSLTSPQIKLLAKRLKAKIVDLSEKYGLTELGNFERKVEGLAAVQKGVANKGDIVAYMKAMAQGEIVEGIDRTKLNESWNKHQEIVDYLKEKLRQARPKKHEWIPCDQIMNVINRAANVAQFQEGVAWVDLQHKLRIDTSWIIFKPSKAILDASKRYTLLQGHIGAVYLEPGHIIQTTGTTPFHNACRVAFDEAHSTTEFLTSIRSVFAQWMWKDEQPAPSPPIHPRLETADGTRIASNLSTVINTQRDRYTTTKAILRGYLRLSVHN